MATLVPFGKQQFTDASGASLALGTVDFYVPGTTTRKDTWQDAGQTIFNTNPVLLDAGGYAIIYGSGTYRQVVKDVLGNVIWDRVVASDVSPGTYLFSSLPGLQIINDVITTSGYYSIGVGAARYVYDAAVNAAYVAANPLTSFISANNRGFHLDFRQRLTVEMFGAVADCSTSNGSMLTFNSTYISSGFTATLATPTGVTDNAAPFAAAMSFATLFTGANDVGAAVPIYFENYNPAYCYYTSQTLVPPGVICFKGNNTGGDSYPSIGTIIRFPANTNGIIFNHTLTQPSGYQAVGAGNSLLEGIWFQGGGGTTRTAHGLWQRVPIVMRNCVFDSFAGNNTHNVGYVGKPTTDPTFGLTSGTNWDRVTCRGAGNWNSYTIGSDVSASTFRDLHHKGSRLGGLFDGGYFTNDYPGYQNNAHGGGAVGAVYYSGRNYFLVDTTPGIGGTTTPGTNDAIWEDYGAAAGPTTGRYPTWVSGGSYEVSTPVWTTSAVLTSPYIENYYLPMFQTLRSGASGTFIAGGVNQTAKNTNQFTPSSTGYTFTKIGFQVRKTYSPANTNGDTLLTSRIGPLGFGSDIASILAYSRSSENSGNFEWTLACSGADVRFGYGQPGGAYNDVYRVTGINTTTTFGRASGVSQVFEASFLAIGDAAGHPAQSRIVRMVTAMPTSGAVGQGEIMLLNAPSAGSTPGYVATTGGTVGSTAVLKAMANLAA